MKKILLIVFPLFISLATQAQSFIPASGSNDTVFQAWTSGSSIELHNNIASSSATPITLKWKVISYKFDVGYDAPGTGICDNQNCYTDVPGLYNATSYYRSDPYTATAGDFHVLYSVNNPAPGTSAKVTVRAIDTVSNYARTLTFVLYRAALGIGQTGANDNSVTLYPNPARESVNVIFDKQTDVKTIAIYNMIGKTMRVFKPSDNNSAKLDLDAIPSGIYFVRLMNGEGQIVATRRFTRQ